MVRRLTLLVRTSKGTLPLIVAASVSAADCGVPTESHRTSTGGSGGARDASTSGGSGGSAGVIVLDASSGFGGISPVGGSGGLGDSGPCPWSSQTYTVELPPEGVPALPGQICSVSTEPVISNRAARVTLDLTTPGDLSVARGFVEIDANLLDLVIGDPVIQVVDTTVPELFSLEVSGLTREATGYSFQATFSAPLPPIEANGYARMTVRVTLELDCAPQPETRVVHAATDVHVCVGEGAYTWVSSGDDCIVCRVIAEMAPSPIVPDKAYDDLPLARAMRLRIVELARISNTVILLAENDGGDGLQYEWHASAGRLSELAPDVVAWTLEDGMPDPFIQAAVLGPATASVASYAFNEAS